MTCPICQSPSRVLDPDMYLHWCPACRHTFTLLPPEAQETYDPTYFDDAHKRWFDNPDVRLFQRVERFLVQSAPPPPVRLLDAGCGRGDFLKWLQPRHPDWDLTGIDLAPNRHPDITFIQGDILRADLKGPFDFITSFMVVEHVEQIRPFLEKMHSLLADRGTLMVNTFNNDSLIFRLARGLHRVGLSVAYRRLYSPHHVQHYSKPSIREVLIRSGFEIVKHQCHNYPLRAVDVPEAGPVMEWAYRMFVGGVFLVSDPLGMGIEHTVFCRPAPRP